MGMTRKRFVELLPDDTLVAPAFDPDGMSLRELAAHLIRERGGRVKARDLAADLEHVYRSRKGGGKLEGGSGLMVLKKMQRKGHVVIADVIVDGAPEDAGNE